MKHAIPFSALPCRSSAATGRGDVRDLMIVPAAGGRAVGVAGGRTVGQATAFSACVVPVVPGDHVEPTVVDDERGAGRADREHAAAEAHETPFSACAPVWPAPVVPSFVKRGRRRRRATVTHPFDGSTRCR